MFIAAGIARRARIALCKLPMSQINKETPSWDGHGGEIKTLDLSVPVADKSYWEGRYALTELTIKKPDGEILVINDATVSISRAKNIVKTALVGLDGTIKEYISNGDYDIQINVGIIAVENGVIVDEYPEEGVRTVRKFLEINEAVEIQSIFFDIFDISRVVITNLSIKQETASNRQTIEIKALSDEDYEIKCNEY